MSKKSKKKTPIIPPVLQGVTKKSTKAKSTYFHGGLFGRADTRLTFKSKKGKKKPLKTTVLIDADKIKSDNPGFDEATFETKYQQEITAAKTYRPVSKVIKLSKNDSPLKVMTPQGSVAKRVSRIGGVSLFSNDPALVRVNLFATKKPKKKYLSSELKEKLVDVSTTTKSQEVKITKKSLEKIRKRNKKNKGKRIVSQNRFMTKLEFGEKFGRATEHAKAAGIIKKGETADHSHLIAHSLTVKEEDAQRAKNSIIATSHSNTEVIAIEQAARDLVKDNDHSFHYKAVATHQSHIGLTETYTIKSKSVDFAMELDINPQTKNKPHQDQIKYVTEAIKKVHDTVKESQHKKQSSKKNSSKPAAQTHATLFSKSALRVELQKNKNAKHKKKLHKKSS